MQQKISYLLCFFALLIGGKSYAAGGPDAYGYTWISSMDPGGPTYNWIDITSYPGVQTVSGLADDNSANSMINLGFDFHYYWQDVNQIKVGSNGWLSFNNVSNIASCFPTIPTAGGSADHYLAPFMGDLSFIGAGNPGSVKYWSNNIDTFIISYINVPFWTTTGPQWTGSNSFQVILSAADSSITFQYGALSGFYTGPGCNYMTVGIENSTGNIGLQVYTNATPPANFAVRFEYPPVVLLSVPDVRPRWNDNSNNRAQIIPLNAPKMLQTNYYGAGNTDVNSSITLQTTILNSVAGSVYTASGSLPSLAFSDDTTVTATPDWTPSLTGQFTFRSTCSNAADINPSNDVLNTELDVVDMCQSNMTLSYTTGNVAGQTLNWNGGGGNDDGISVHFIPPVAPYDVTTIEFYISANISDNFIANIYDDDGPNGSPGTLLFTQTIPAASIVTGAWNTVTLSTPVTINDGGFHVAWIQGGTNIYIGIESTVPFSNRNYEILNGSWAEYRFNSGQDAMIRATINNYTSTPTAGFSFADNGNGDFQYTDLTTGPYLSWSWDFGDGNTSTAQHPTHTFASPGTYTVCLIASTPCGSDTICQTITYCSPSSAAYSQTNTGLDVSFTDLSSGNIQAWVWDFGDGGTSTQQNPTHTYATAGNYNVCLVTADACGNLDTLCQAVTVCDNPGAAFAPSSNGLTLTFTDLSLGTVDSWSWDFGDGNTSSQQNPAHTYANAGQYTVCLTVANSCGVSNNICAQITVCEQPLASFDFTSNGTSAVFNDLSSGTVDSWSWDFGDGNSSNAQNPAHTYAADGNYTVCLVIVNQCGDADTLCQNVVISSIGLQENSLLQVSAWPNPVESYLTISMNVPLEDAKIVVTDLSGRIVWSATAVNGTSATMDVTALSSGYYHLTILQANGSGNLKFLKD